MLLAAGRGERMRPLTDHTPKPLLEAGGRPLIVWHIDRLARAGITELVINHAHLGAQIEASLGDGSRFGAHIRYSSEGTALETAGGIAFALHLLSDQPFAVINCDIFCDYDFAQLRTHANKLNADGDTAHLVLVNNPPQHPNGDFGISNGRVTKTVPSILDPQSSIPHPASRILTFSGIGIYRPEVFSQIPRGSIAPLAPLLRAQIALGKVSGEHHPGFWADVGTPQRLAELDRQVRSQHNTP